MYDYENYEDEVINESALDMAMDMSDRYGVAVEDAYEFACGVLEGSSDNIFDRYKKTRDMSPEQRDRRSRAEKADNPFDRAAILNGHDPYKKARERKILESDNIFDRYAKQRILEKQKEGK